MPMTPKDEQDGMARAQRMLRDIFAPHLGCGCPDGFGCAVCDAYHLLPRALRRSDANKEGV